MNYQDIINLIDKSSEKYHETPVDDEITWYTLETECYFAIFEYCDKIGIKIEGYDLRKILDAEDDEDEGVPPEGQDEALHDIRSILTDPSDPNFIKAPDEVVHLFKYYERKFWPLTYDD